MLVELAPPGLPWEHEQASRSYQGTFAQVRQIPGGRTVGAGWKAACQGQRVGRPEACVLSQHPPGKPWQEMPVAHGSRNHVTRQGKEVSCWSYGSITHYEMMGATR